jgi:hypothetical protein
MRYALNVLLSSCFVICFSSIFYATGIQSGLHVRVDEQYFETRFENNATNHTISQGDTPPIRVENSGTAPHQHKEIQKNKFYEWDDIKGIDINSLLSYFEWFTSVGLETPEKFFGWNHFPHLPIIITKKNPKSKMIEVAYSCTAMKKFPAYKHFLKDRVKPMLQFMKSALNQNRDRDRTLPRHELDRLYQALDRGTQIPMLFDMSDDADCGKGHLVYQGPMTNDTLTEFNLPLFSMGRNLNCNFAFPFPTYLAIRHAKDNGTEWDKYFETSAEAYPWKDKKPSAVFRGANTGSKKKYNREWLVKFGKNEGNGTLIDALIPDKKTPELYIPFEDFQKYKAVIDIDGNGWSGRFLRLLCMNSVVVKLQPYSVDHNMGSILPWVHYIPADFNSSLADRVKFAIAEENEHVVEGIIANAQGWCRENLTLENLKDDVLDILASYVNELDRGRLQHWEQTWELKSNSSFQEVLAYLHV